MPCDVCFFVGKTCAVFFQCPGESGDFESAGGPVLSLDASDV